MIAANASSCLRSLLLLVLPIHPHSAGVEDKVIININSQFKNPFQVCYFFFIQLCIKNVNLPRPDITFKVAWIICRSIGFSLDLCCLLSLAFNSSSFSSTHLPSPGPPMGSLPGSEAVPRHPTKRYLHIIAVSAFGNLTAKSSLSLDNSQSGEFSHWCWSWPCPPRSSTFTQHAPSSTARVVASSSRSTPSSSPPSTQQCSSSDSDRP